MMHPVAATCMSHAGGATGEASRGSSVQEPRWWGQMNSTASCAASPNMLAACTQAHLTHAAKKKCNSMHACAYMRACACACMLACMHV
eukprot:365331-Chlamydomonas_euryale.AAC.4